MTQSTSVSSLSISILNGLLQGERSAVGTYDHAQLHLEGEYATEIEANRSCHAKRIDILTHRIHELDGEALPYGPGWMELRDNSTHAHVITALEQGEIIGLEHYNDSLLQIDPMSKDMILEDLLPAQERTHWRMAGLKQMVP